MTTGWKSILLLYIFAWNLDRGRIAWKIKYFWHVSYYQNFIQSHLPNDTKNPPNAQFIVTTMSKMSKEKQINDGISPAWLETMRSWRMMAGAHKRFICCFIKSNLRTPLPLVLVTIWKHDRRSIRLLEWQKYSILYLRDFPWDATTHSTPMGHPGWESRDIQ